jgi:YbbR domain-containing protein
MRWIVDDWRLKLLALGLAVVMLGAVAFAQTPATSKTFHPIVNYTLPPDLIVLNPVNTVAATVYGLSETVQSMTDSSLTASVDASKASPGPAVRLTIVISSVQSGVSVQNPRVPVALNIDRRAIQDLQVQVTTHPAAGWSVTKAQALCGGITTSPCVVHFDGPQSWEKAANMIAVVNYTTPVQANSYDSSNWPIQLRNSNGLVDPLTCNTRPTCGLDINTVAIHVDAQQGSTSTTVPLVDAAPSNGPPAGYRITGITINPSTVVISGDSTVLGRIQRITLPAVDLSNATSTASFQVAIPYPEGVTSIAGLQRATITYQIAKNPNVAPSPSP